MTSISGSPKRVNSNRPVCLAPGTHSILELPCAKVVDNVIEFDICVKDYLSERLDVGLMPFGVKRDGGRFHDCPNDTELQA
jgi:hypothetical protein